MTIERSVTISLIEVTCDGFAYVFFSEPIDTFSNLTLAKLGFDVELIPAVSVYERHGLDFEWEIEELNQDKMTISHSFTNPQEISSNGKRKLDKLRVKVKKDTENFFRAQRSLVETLVTFELEASQDALIPPQLSGNLQTIKLFLAAVKYFDSTAKTLVLIVLSSNTIMNASLSQLLNMVNSL